MATSDRSTSAVRSAGISEAVNCSANGAPSFELELAVELEGDPDSAGRRLSTFAPANHSPQCLHFWATALMVSPQ